jgi:hypothetical protein
MLLSCKFGLHKFEYCKQKEHCNSNIRICERCHKTECCRDGVWIACSEDRNLCDWSFACFYEKLAL